MERFWKVFDRIVAVAGFVLVGVGTYCTALTYYRDHPAANVSSAHPPPSAVPLVMPPWWAGALLAVGLGMLITAWLRSRAPNAPVAGHPVAEKGLVLQEPALGEAVAEQVKQKTKVMDDLFALQKAREYSEGRWRQMYWRIEHDINTPEFIPLSPEDAKWVQREISRFTTVLNEMRNALPTLATFLRQHLLARGVR